MADHTDFADKLGIALERAARASVAAGAQYEPGETIHFDSKEAWKVLAKHLCEYIDERINEISSKSVQERPKPSHNEDKVE